MELNLSGITNCDLSGRAYASHLICFLRTDRSCVELCRGVRLAQADCSGVEIELPAFVKRQNRWYQCGRSGELITDRQLGLRDSLCGINAAPQVGHVP